MRLHPLFISLFFFWAFIPNSFAIRSISIMGDAELFEVSISKYAIEDAHRLLAQACHCELSYNQADAEVLIILPHINQGQANKQGKGFYVPEHAYSWSSKVSGPQTKMELLTNSYQGVSMGLYGLLQEQLGFQFFHPKQSFIPNLTLWPIANGLDWQARPRFAKKGFHLHTMHPIELTEALLDPNYPDAEKEVKRYIDWLARNQQNYFEFNLLNSIDQKTWMPYIKKLVDYGQKRGLLMGIDISMHMTQQKAFQLYQTFPNSLKSKEKQIEENMDYLAQAGWDVYNVEFSTTEFSKGNQKKKQELEIFLADLIKNRYKAHFMSRAHVVQEEAMLDKKEELPELSGDDLLLERSHGLMVHTVMFYDLQDERAPVYNNENLKAMLALYQEEVKKRECWYFPESAYWITFDNSVPMTLLPYLSARLEDIQLMDSLKAEGHITFSSGWEWSYWLIDWSIARWSWEHQIQGEKEVNDPLQYLAELMQNDLWTDPVWSMLRLQEEFIKDKELIRYMAPSSTTDELPGRLGDMEFQPRPLYSYPYIQNQAAPHQLDTVSQTIVAPLLDFALRTEELLALQERHFPQTNIQKQLAGELANSLQITALRARHRAYTINYLLDKRRAKLRKEKFEDPNKWLEKAKSCREEAQKIVKKQEALYRYPLEYIAQLKEGHTAYAFGYLYSVSNLHFWEREEEQVRTGKFQPLFKNLWDLPRILGIVK